MLKMKEGQNPVDHINLFNRIMDQFQKFGIKIEEEDKALLLITLVSNSYESVMTKLLYRKDTLEFENV